MFFILYSTPLLILHLQCGWVITLMTLYLKRGKHDSVRQLTSWKQGVEKTWSKWYLLSMFGNSAHYPISIPPNSPLLTSSNVWSHKAKCRNKLLFKFVLLVKSMFSRHNNGGMSLFFFSHRWWFLFFTAYL